jgi:hypothetical protein
MGKAVVSLVALSSALAAALVVQWHELRDLRSTVSFRRTDSGQACSLDKATRPSVEEVCRTAASSSELVAPQPAPMSTAGSLDFDSRLRQDPKFQAAMIDYQKIDMRQRYSGLIARLRLPAAKAAQLAQLMAEQWARGDHGIPAEYTREQWKRQLDDELLSVLSPAQLEVLHGYKETAATRDQVDSLRSELIETREPLRDDQIEPLVDALYTEEAKFMAEISAFNDALDKGRGAIEESERKAAGYFAEREAAATERKLTAAGALLSSGQLRALERQLQAQQSLGVAGSNLRRVERELAQSLQRSSEP